MALHSAAMLKGWVVPGYDADADIGDTYREYWHRKSANKKDEEHAVIRVTKSTRVGLVTKSVIRL